MSLPWKLTKEGGFYDKYDPVQQQVLMRQYFRDKSSCVWDKDPELCRKLKNKHSIKFFLIFGGVVLTLLIGIGLLVYFLVLRKIKRV